MVVSAGAIAAMKLGAAGLSFGGSFLGASSAKKAAYKQYKYQSALQSQAAKLNYDYSLKSAENMPSSTRKGLEAANYNPMLAVQNSTAGANSSWTSSGQAVAPDIVGGMSQGLANAQSFQRLQNETMQAESVTDANYATADKAKAEKAMLIEKLPWVSKQEKANYMKTTMEAAKLENDIHLANEMLKLQETGVDVNVKSYQLEKAIQDILRDREDRYKKWGDEHPYLRNFDETLIRYFGKPSISATKKI